MAILTSLRRSPSSIETYGDNVKVLLHMGEGQRIGAIVQTSKDYLIIYSLILSSNTFDSAKYKFDTSRGGSQRRRSFVALEPEIIMPYSVKQRRMIKVDSGLSLYRLFLSRLTTSYIALDDQLIIATEHPPAIQRVLWQEPSKPPHTELISKMDWMKEHNPVTQMVFDKSSNLFAWVTKEGNAYVVQKPGVYPIALS
jgi:hypothetical protein